MKKKVAFVCVHNSCRSQIAEALAKEIYSDKIEAYSAGTQLVEKINQDAVRIMKDIYNIDMEKTQFSKLVTDLPDIDILVKMGCNVICPYLPNEIEEDWGLDDPSGKDDKAFIDTISKIKEKLDLLVKRIA